MAVSHFFTRHVRTNATVMSNMTRYFFTPLRLGLPNKYLTKFNLHYLSYHIYLFVILKKKIPHYYTEIIYLKNTNTPAWAKHLASFSFLFS